MNTTTDTPTPSPHKHENTNSKLEELAKLEYDAVSGPIKAQDKLYSELESLRHDRLALMIANGANLKEATALKARVEKIEAELAEKNAEIEAFKANNRYMRGHTAGYEEAERKWKTRAEKAEKELAEAINSDCESMAMFRRVRDERDALREEIEHIKAWANAKSDEVIALERNLYTGDDDEKKWLRAEVKRLKDQIGYIEASEHPDEQNPRAQTWLQERKNWIAEVERLRETLRTIKS